MPQPHVYVDKAKLVSAATSDTGSQPRKVGNLAMSFLGPLAAAGGGI
jgi:hypothetical protein